MVFFKKKDQYFWRDKTKKINCVVKKNIMKKLLAILFVATVTFGATSCSKDYNCDCPAVGSLEAEIFPLENSSKTEAKLACTGFENVRKLIEPTATCELK